MNVAELRHRVTGTNIANALSPGHKAQRVSFEEALDRSAPQLEMRATHPSHSGSQRQMPEPRVVPSESPRLPNGINDVDIEREMATLARNRIQFRALASFASRQYRQLSQAIGRSGT